MTEFQLRKQTAGWFGHRSTHGSDNNSRVLSKRPKHISRVDYRQRAEASRAVRATIRLCRLSSLLCCFLLSSPWAVLFCFPLLCATVPALLDAKADAGLPT